jgi:hypothetical protein
VKQRKRERLWFWVFIFSWMKIMISLKNARERRLQDEDVLSKSVKIEESRNS